MKFSARPLFIGAAIAFLFTLTLAAFAREQPVPPTAPPPPEAAPAAAPAEPVVPEAEKPVAVEKSTLRRIDADEPADIAPTNPQPAVGAKTIRRVIHKNRSSNDQVRFAEDIHVESTDKVDGAAVAIFGDVLVDGSVNGDVTAVGGDVTINGTVHGNVVAVFGDVTLGPKAVIEGDVTTVNGATHNDPAAAVGGKVSTETIGKRGAVSGPMHTWWRHGVSRGGLLGLGTGMFWLWMFSLVGLVFYALLGLVFPNGIRRTGDILAQRPGAVVLTAVLTMLALPILFVVLLITVIGIPVALLGLPVGIFIGVLFGKAAIYGLVGRAVAGNKLPTAVAVLIGGLIFILLYLVPILGLGLSLLTSALGLGCAITVLLTSEKKTVTPPPVVPMPAPAVRAAVAPVSAAEVVNPVPVAAADQSFSAPGTEPAMAAPWAGEPSTTSPSTQSGGFGAATPTAPPTVPGAAPFTPVWTQPLPPLVPNATLPRAGFWLRTGAVLIDLVLIGIICGPIRAGPAILPVLAAYGAAMWKFKGTTIGGIVCGLRVVRLDDRPLDWPTTVVRALGCFLSLAVAGLGFVWVVFDGERQSWHDKIAGTVVVRAPKGTSLV